jgi:hypothetical protein
VSHAFQGWCRQRIVTISLCNADAQKRSGRRLQPQTTTIEWDLDEPSWVEWHGMTAYGLHLTITRAEISGTDFERLDDHSELA